MMKPKMNHLSIKVQRDVNGQWLAEVQQLPTLRSYCQSHEGAIAKVQVLALHWLAAQIEQGKMKPLEFSIAVREATQSIGSAFQDAVVRLEGANALSFDPKTQRDGAMVAVAAARELLCAMGIPTHILWPLLQLVMALQDLKHGTIAPILRPEGKSQNKPLDSTAAWSVRAFLAGALEARIRMGEQVQSAAARVAKDAKAHKVSVVGAKRESAPDARRIIQLRKDFRRPIGAGPREGLHLHAWRTIIQAAEEASRKPESERLGELEQIYWSAILLAARQR